MELMLFIFTVIFAFMVGGWLQKRSHICEAKPIASRYPYAPNMHLTKHLMDQTLRIHLLLKTDHPRKVQLAFGADQYNKHSGSLTYHLEDGTYITVYIIETPPERIDR